MKILLFRIFPFFLLISSIKTKGQQDIQKESAMEQKMEAIADIAEEAEIDYTLIFDELLYYTEHPINLNRTSKEELSGLQILSELQMNNLFEHIEKNGKLISVIELQAVDGFDLQTIHKILPFVTVISNLDTPRITFKEMIKNGQHQFIERYQTVLEDQKGYLPSNDSLAGKSGPWYLGSKARIYTRYRFNYGNKVSCGFTGEKDPGEEFFRGTQKQGFDFYTAHLFIRDIGFLKSLAIGDYQVQFGQGLTYWSGLAFGKSSFALNLNRQGIGLRPSGSVDENRFMRGVGLTIGSNNILFTAFGSYKNIDANFNSISDTIKIGDEIFLREESVISSFQHTGFHRTQAEIAGKNSINESIYGGNLAYKKRNFNLGITAVRSAYKGILQRNLSFYNQFEFNNSQNLNTGIDYNWVLQNMNFFGEVARSKNGGFSITNGLLISVDPRLSVIIMHRKYDRAYQPISAAAVSDGNINANEQGIYTGIALNPIQKFSLTAYYDRFVFPWMKYLVNAPSHGSDFLVQFNFTPSRKTEMYFRIRQRDKFKNVPESINEITPITGFSQINYRYNVSYSLTPFLAMRNRVEIVKYQVKDFPQENGYIIFQDLIYKSLRFPVALSMRYAIFETDSWNSRLYTYESDVLYAFSIPAYYMRGSRVYAMLKYTFKRKLTIWLRYGQTYYYNRLTIGSGPEEINGNIRSEIKIQLRYKF